MKVARDLMVEIPVLRFNDYITKARQILRDDIFRELYVRDEKNSLMGYIDITDVLRVIDTKSNVTIEGYIKEAAAITPETSLEEVAITIRREMSNSAVVVDGNGLVQGAILLSDLFPILLTRHELQGTVADSMSPHVISCQPDDSIQKIYTLIIESGYAAFPVEKNGAIIGMISRSDLLKKGKVLKSVGNSSKTSVESVMTTPAIVVLPADGIDIAAKKMAKHNISRLPVVDEGRIVGILDRHDVLKALTL